MVSIMRKILYPWYCTNNPYDVAFPHHKHFFSVQSAENQYLRSLKTQYFKDFQGLRPSTRPPSCFTQFIHYIQLFHLSFNPPYHLYLAYVVPVLTEINSIFILQIVCTPANFEIQRYPE